ncbi:MAG: tRNA (adenosine(37)-N6)-threonylcarbamoyltransferase complex dimerization subunit type 1 TsaB [Bacillota bacterium]|jgi:tRNA threonylcarbamoyladenosine biosynthesis protein TsaB|nr:tRNA (adenosine(37)-N6)-threonylcarbamoyltransferase complex dimerization subunit type 1 TsaB [Bacillota bacterium]HHU43627.1 tRNA (adenosine(37)-N6)-threonylcarbamoyltransferase complex dimerization subunit type 1 TsaB [Clostridiales bacterium]
MNFLAIDTTMDCIAIAISYGEKKITKLINEGKKRHNTILLSAIENLLTDNDIKLEDMDAFGVVVGPGSFTGIRVGVAVINAMSMALKKPIIGMTALELAKINYPDEDILSLIDCRHQNYYAAYFKGESVEYLALNQTELKDIPAKKVLIEKPDPNLLYLTMNKKISQKDFIKKAKPFYLKKSSAERENERKTSQK